MHIKPLLAALFCFSGIGVATSALLAQAVPSARTHETSITAGATFSIFQPDYQGGTSAYANGESLFHGLLYGIDGPGGFIDVRFRRWVQFEAEARWMRFSACSPSESTSGTCNSNASPEDSYLVGPRIPFRLGRFTPYAKVLGGYGITKLASGNSLDGYVLAYGAGTDFRLTKRLNLRLVDFELQKWFLNTPTGNFTIQPFGASAGISYKVF
jgi:hypothetical protein